MPRHTTIATALDKHKISSSVAYIVMLEVSVIDPSSRAIVEMIRIANNNELIQWQGNSFHPAFFEIDVTYEQDKLPSVSLSFRDFQGVMQASLQAHHGLTGSNVRMLVINTSVPDNPPEMDENFVINSAKANASDYTVALTMGCENPIGLRFPPFVAFRDHCRFVYKGAECGYAGTLPSCDLSFSGTNGCKTHNNTLRFGGFPGIHVGTY
jgi:phage-related protein